MKMSSDELSAWIKVIYEICGTQLDASKAYLIENRLAELAASKACTNMSALLTLLRKDEDVKKQVIDLITTHETSFFRDQQPFEMLRDRLAPEILLARQKAGRPAVLRVWIAACSTGQEVWSTLMALREGPPIVANANISIVATDISEPVLAKAAKGQYLALDIERGLSAVRLKRYFDDQNDVWEVKPELKKCVEFKRLNLLDPFSFSPVFDIVMCRNVAIYFSEADKIKLFKNISRNLAPDGSLLLGSTESIPGLCPEFETLRYEHSIFYKMKTKL